MFFFLCVTISQFVYICVLVLWISGMTCKISLVSGYRISPNRCLGVCILQPSFQRQLLCLHWNMLWSCFRGQVTNCTNLNLQASIYRLILYLMPTAALLRTKIRCLRLLKHYLEMILVTLSWQQMCEQSIRRFKCPQSITGVNNYSNGKLLNLIETTLE